MIRFKYFQRIVFGICGMMLAVSAFAIDTFVVEEIRVEGLQRISAGAVFVVLPIQIGDEIDNNLSARAIESLYNTGFFDDIVLRRDGNVLVISVIERATLSTIEIQGNEKIKTEQIEQALAATGITEGSVYNPGLTDQFIAGLQQEYLATGRFKAQVSISTTPIERNRINLLIDIYEGPISLIKDIRFVGNSAYGHEDLMDLMKLSTKKSLVFFNRNNRYSRTKLTADLERITSEYQNAGFVNFQVVSAQTFVSDDRDDIFIVITLDEGEQFQFGEVRVIGGDEEIPAEEIEQLISQPEGATFSRQAVNTARSTIESQFADRGYSLANVEAIPNVRDEDAKIDIEYSINPGQLIYVRRILFSGNIVTNDEVLRREMRISEGSIYSATGLAQSRQRLNRLGFFQNVGIRAEAIPDAPDQVDIYVDVVETFTGSLTFGVGYSETDKALLDLSVQQRNLYGTGNRISAHLSSGSVATELSFNYVNPYYTTAGVSRGFHLSRNITDSTGSVILNYKLKSNAAGIRYRFPTSEVHSIGVTAEAQSYEFEDRGLDPKKLDSETLNFIEDNASSVVGRALISFRLDSRDRAIFPSDGSLRQVSLETTAGDIRYYVVRSEWTEYFPFGDQSAFRLTGRVDYGDGFGSTRGLPFFTRFYAGGSSTVRGFGASSLGPAGVCKGEGEDGKVGTIKCSVDHVVGGNLRVLARSEVYLPILGTRDTNDRRFSLFLDAGNVFEDSFDSGEVRASVGASFTWLSPIGPLGLSYAHPVREKQGDNLDRMQIILGTFID